MDLRRIPGWICGAADYRGLTNQADSETKKPLVFFRKSTARRLLRIWLRGEVRPKKQRHYAKTPANSSFAGDFRFGCGFKKVTYQVYHRSMASLIS